MFTTEEMDQLHEKLEQASDLLADIMETCRLREMEIHPVIVHSLKSAFSMLGMPMFAVHGAIDCGFTVNEEMENRFREQFASVSPDVDFDEFFWTQKHTIPLSDLPPLDVVAPEATSDASES